MKEFRCKRCQRLLGRYWECEELEIKCPRCGFVNKLMNFSQPEQMERPTENCKPREAVLLLPK